MKNQIVSPKPAWILVPAALGALLLGCFLVSDWILFNDDAGGVVRGKVVSREKASVGLMSRPKLNIVIAGTDEKVHAILMVNSGSKIPDEVSFKYSGPPGSEVQLLEESSSLVVGSIMLALGLAAMILVVWLKPWRK